ncbi:P-loop containing nucleoside triphosphate hydrolase protein [Geranomyces variabilis]|nr:P-loop containing nucleoside triphosphate hydrolase protein [Geranomyces variabilis]
MNVALQAWLSILPRFAPRCSSPSSGSSQFCRLPPSLRHPLVLTYLMSITQDLNLFVVIFAFVGAMTAPFGPVLEYVDLVPEKDIPTPTVDLPANWPAQGKIEFREYSLRYKDGAAPVIKNLNVIFEAGHKIGVCGRTGAGKSSLAQALLHFIPLVTGALLIDGTDIDALPLHSLRSKVGLVTQEPVVFSQTIRFNLDPFGKHGDEELWAVLEDINLKKHILDLKGGLDFLIEDGESSFSLGQRQLVSLARAVLRDADVSVPRPRATVSFGFRASFAHANRTAIAHRIDTITACDKVLVLDAGKILEFDNPRTLLLDSESAFSKLHSQK